MDITPQFPRIRQQIAEHGGYLPVTFVQSLLSECDFTIDQLLQAMIPLVRTTAVAPISHFHAAAIVLGASGNLYIGANQEYLSAPLSFAVHAEQAAMVMAHLHGETAIIKMVASDKPCGHCRQFINEIEDAHQLDILMPDQSTIKLAHLLPHAFGPRNLGVRGGMLSSEPQSLQLAQATQHELVASALQAANQSYSPYAKAYSGVALRVKDGRIFKGSYLENAAFNPSLPALQAAFIHLIQSGASFDEVTEVVLVQAEQGAVNHVGMAELTLATVCPQLALQVYTAK